MQQIGGSLGLAILSTVAVTAAGNKTKEILTSNPTANHNAVSAVAFTHGSVMAFEVGAAMIGLGAIIVFAFMRVSHNDLANDGAHGVADDEPIEALV